MMLVLHGAHVLLALVMERAPVLLVLVLQLPHLVSHLLVHRTVALLALLDGERRACCEDQRRRQHEPAQPKPLPCLHHDRTSFIEIATTSPDSDHPMRPDSCDPPLSRIRWHPV